MEQGIISRHQGMGPPCSAPKARFSKLFFVSLVRAVLRSSRPLRRKVRFVQQRHRSTPLGTPRIHRDSRVSPRNPARLYLSDAIHVHHEQPQVAPQFPFGGDVSASTRCVAAFLFFGAEQRSMEATDAARPPPEERPCYSASEDATRYSPSAL